MLRHLDNNDLFKLYDNDLVLRLRNAKNLSDTRKMLAKLKEYLNGCPPSPELAKGFLSQFANRKPRTLYRYTQRTSTLSRASERNVRESGEVCGGVLVEKSGVGAL